ncbi:MAG: amidohydrolase [Saprospiraceae bacterium]|jgi:predicted amidohydrolase YtcJ|nr:amidohydrolase [Saprospiraceae bacterium]
MKKSLGALIIVVAVVLFYGAFSDYNKSNDLIFYGGNIITLEDRQPTVEAILVKDGKIIAVGTMDSIIRLKNAKTKVINLEGKTMLPGFIDPHGHYDFAAVFRSMTDVSGVIYRKPDEVWHRIIEAVNKAEPGEWVYCYGMDPILTEGISRPTLQYLDSIAPDNPLVIITKALHVFYANSKAFGALGINKGTKDPSDASYYEKDANGNLTGAIFEQEALEPFRHQIQSDIKEDFVKNTQLVMKDYASFGVTSAVNMGLPADKKSILTLYSHIAAEKADPLQNLISFTGKLPKRYPHQRLFIYLRKENFDLLPIKDEQQDDFFKIIGIKMWYDGSPYAGSMYLRQPYIRSDFTINGINLNPNHRSHPLLRQDELMSWIEKTQTKGYQVAIHAQGDIAHDDVVSVFKQLHIKSQINPYRHRVEHCMLLPGERIDELKSMSVTPGFHINHVLYYGDFLSKEILGEERANQIFPIASVAKTGLPFSLHADMPQFYPNPLLLASTAINRKTEAGHVYNDKEKISVWEALKGITIYPAWQLHMENKLGTIKPGKYADLVILDKNPLSVNPEVLDKILVLETIVAGNTIYRKK